MRLHFLRHTFIALIVLLIVNLPAVTVAEQHSVHPEAQAAIAPDTESMQLAAKVAAERDANSDVNRLMWFGTSIKITAIGAGVGALGGCGVGSLLNPETVDPFGGACIVPIPNREQAVGSVVGMLVGALIGSSASLIGTYNYSPNPPTERFIGKSPEYVDFYTEAYTQKTRSIRTQSAAAGTATCFGLSLIGCLVFQDP